jgi:hypothetical protein
MRYTSAIIASATADFVLKAMAIAAVVAAAMVIAKRSGGKDVQAFFALAV